VGRLQLVGRFMTQSSCWDCWDRSHQLHHAASQCPAVLSQQRAHWQVGLSVMSSLQGVVICAASSSLQVS
jgi:sterol desaturase/sphingolipid hydroxylase (fatty acid hydroxylase superfamily)